MYICIFIYFSYICTYVYVYIHIHIEMAVRAHNLTTRITVGGSSMDALHFQPILTFCTIILHANKNHTTHVYQIAF